MKLIVAAALLLAVCATMMTATAEAADVNTPACHNSTGSCRKHHFVCANEELVPHAKRCDGVEDCADGTDEYMCDQRADTPFHERTVAERDAIIETSCIFCTCPRGSITVLQSGDPAWWRIATTAPRDLRLMTYAVTLGNPACHPTRTSQIQLNVYKKQNKGCRGWVCCFRQQNCVACGTGLPTRNCWP
jgi:hypothetical protein